MITMHSVDKFLSSFEKVVLLQTTNDQGQSAVPLGARAFEEIGGEETRTTSFVLSKNMQMSVFIAG